MQLYHTHCSRGQQQYAMSRNDSKSEKLKSDPLWLSRLWEETIAVDVSTASTLGGPYFMPRPFFAMYFWVCD